MQRPLANSKDLKPVTVLRTEPAVCLSIAGLDPSGGAGILADVRTFAAFGCFPAAAVTSVTFQNTEGVFGSVSQSPECVRRQIVPVFDDYEVAAVKTGMLPDSGVIKAVADVVLDRRVERLVVDPVVRSTSGFDLIDDAALRSLIENLFPIAALVTPNLPEAERIAGFAIESLEDISKAAGKMRDLGAKNVLIKGGHVPGEETGEFRIETRKAVDFLFLGEDLVKLEAEYIETDATHGTGCVLSSAIAARLATGSELEGAVRSAKLFVNKAIRSAPLVGKGHSPINIDPRLVDE
ncbi:MAG: bifunctional hydroxymethylpyrimidine kinase/phosphomethylpyrimidine kinase [Acidobacteriota bacterium]|nr:MAG: bifunctional hydroxymethylpyrimidine kinase/phosphomethylpyrimidine kinase [Acidobacteriota bacterium]